MLVVIYLYCLGLCLFKPINAPGRAQPRFNLLITKCGDSELFYNSRFSVSSQPQKKNKFGIGTKSLMELSTYYSHCVFVTLSFDFSQLADISLSIVIHVGIYYFSLWWCSSGQVTNLRGYFSDEPSSTPSDIQIILLVYCAKRRKRIKEAGLLPT